MTTDRASEQSRSIDIARRLYDVAIDLALERLECVDAKEKKDNVAFDRVARTAQTLVHLAGDVDALVSRKRKEARDNDQTGDDAEEQRLAKDVAVIKRDLDDYIDQRAREGFAGGAGRAGGEGDASGGNGS